MQITSEIDLDKTMERLRGHRIPVIAKMTMSDMDFSLTSPVETVDAYKLYEGLVKEIGRLKEVISKQHDERVSDSLMNMSDADKWHCGF